MGFVNDKEIHCFIWPSRKVGVRPDTEPGFAVVVDAKPVEQLRRPLVQEMVRREDEDATLRPRGKKLPGQSPSLDRLAQSDLIGEEVSLDGIGGHAAYDRELVTV
jgi:hypothetical protein